jgi:hypothetical protein
MEEIQTELAEAFEELRSIQRLKEKATPTKTRKSSPNVSKEKLTSSWAMSKTTRSGIPTKNISRASSPEQPITLHDKSKSKSFTISKSIKRSIFETTPSTSQDGFNDPKIDILSSQKRSKSAIISNTNRNTTPVRHHDLAGESYEQSEIKDNITTKVYSFSKAKRDSHHDHHHPSNESQSSHQLDLNIDHADKLIRERSQSVLIFPEPKKKKKEIMIPSQQQQQQQQQQRKENENIEIYHQPNLDILSNRLSSTTGGGKMMTPTSSHTLRRKQIDQSDYGHPGPGTYTDSINKIYSIGNSINSKGIKFSSRTESGRGGGEGGGGRGGGGRVKKRLHEPGPGPGSYDVNKADHHITQRISGFSNIFKHDTSIADIKNQTPQLQKKKYWEEKAKDAREDTMVIVEPIRRRIPSTVTIRPDEKKGINYKNREIIHKIRAEKRREATIGYYEKSYVMVEHHIPTPVQMEQQVKSIQNTKAMLESAGIISAAQLRAQEAAQRDYYLGPQLQIPWEDDRVAMMMNPALERNINKDDDDGEESPTEEVLRIIRKRNHQEERIVPIHDTTDAYLKSSYTGTARSRPPTIRMREPTRSDVRQAFDREINVDGVDRDYLPTQLHHDWGENGSTAGGGGGGSTGDYRGKSIQMDIVTGREVKKIYQKGIIETIPFHEPPRQRPEEYAPGDYDVFRGRKFGDDARGGMVDFEKHVSRYDLVGPKGERPDNEILNEREGLEYEEVIINAVNAKEKILKHTEAPQLYVKVGGVGWGGVNVFEKQISPSSLRTVMNNQSPLTKV